MWANAGVAQLVEQLICNQQVGGSSPSTSSNLMFIMGVFPSGQRGQTVNLLRFASVVRIHPRPPFYHYKKDIMPTNGLVKPFVGINLAKNKIAYPC